jgi:hypothetical protein
VIYRIPGVKTKESKAYLETLSSAEVMQQDRMGPKGNIKRRNNIEVSYTAINGIKSSSEQSWKSDMKWRVKTVKFT